MTDEEAIAQFIALHGVKHCPTAVLVAGSGPGDAAAAAEINSREDDAILKWKLAGARRRAARNSQKLSQNLARQLHGLRSL